MLHMRRNQMASGERAAKTELTRKNCRRNDSSQSTGVVARRGWVRASHTQHIKHGTLWLEDRTSANRTHLDRRHRHAHLKVALVAAFRLVTDENVRDGGPTFA